EILDAFIRHRREVVTRRTLFDLRKARDRAHILEGLAVALANIDPVIDLIKAAPNPPAAKEQLIAQVWKPGSVVDMLERAGAEASKPEELGEEYGLHDDGYHLSPVQAQAILDLRLHRLTGLEQEKIIEEYREILGKIADFLEILESPDRLREVIRDELKEVLDQYSDERRTQIMIDYSEMTVEDLISDEDVVVTLSHAGYAKAQPLSDYTAQRRGGKGKSATSMKDEDFIDKLFVASMHDTVLFFTSVGKVYWKRVYELPVASRGARGRPIVNLLPLVENERVSAVLTVREYSEDRFIFFATKNGVVKKTPLTDFSRPRANGIIAIDLRVDDELINVALTDGSRDIMLTSSNGRTMRFLESDVRSMGRGAAGVRGIRMGAEDSLVSLIVVDDGHILTATEKGYGKRTVAEDYPRKKRGGMGVIDIKTSDRNGPVVGAVQVQDNDEVMLITTGGTLIRTAVEGISVVGRNTQGVRLIRIDDEERLVEIERVATTGEESEDADDSDGEAPAADDSGSASVDGNDAPTEGEATDDQPSSDD
ncbi:MAG: DNA gyrase C-terminal beta-propeller domain-containing protein, partial [Pseudomonadota bacterium]